MQHSILDRVPLLDIRVPILQEIKDICNDLYPVSDATTLIQKFKRMIQGVPQSLDAAYPRNQEEETKLTENEYSNKCLTSRTISPLFPKRGD